MTIIVAGSQSKNNAFGVAEMDDVLKGQIHLLLPYFVSGANVKTNEIGASILKQHA